MRVRDLQDEWREQLRESSNPRADAAAWALIDQLPAHPVITVPVGVAASGRTKPAVTNGIARSRKPACSHRSGPHSEIAPGKPTDSWS
jgi:hypothetical protein